MKLLVVAVVVMACSGNSASTPPTDEPDRPVTPAPAPVPTPAPHRLQVKWLAVHATDGCFFFSGPDGRDDKLVGPVTVDRAETGDGPITLKIATATFSGTYREKELLLTRQSTHDFGGAWKVTEQIHGYFFDGVLRGSYRYEECEIASGACPGRCRIDAELGFEK